MQVRKPNIIYKCSLVIPKRKSKQYSQRFFSETMHIIIMIIQMRSPLEKWDLNQILRLISQKAKKKCQVLQFFTCNHSQPLSFVLIRETLLQCHVFFRKEQKSEENALFGFFDNLGCLVHNAKNGLKYFVYYSFVFAFQASPKAITYNSLLIISCSLILSVLKALLRIKY